jgi:hypothetical protein
MGLGPALVGPPPESTRAFGIRMKTYLKLITEMGNLPESLESVPLRFVTVRRPNCCPVKSSNLPMFRWYLWSEAAYEYLNEGKDPHV